MKIGGGTYLRTAVFAEPFDGQGCPSVHVFSQELSRKSVVCDVGEMNLRKLRQKSFGWHGKNLAEGCCDLGGNRVFAVFEDGDAVRREVIELLT